MLFNSLQFLFFFVIVTSLFFLLDHRHRWKLLLAASCYFYMVFQPVYILILFLTIVIDYFAGIYIEKSQGKRRKHLLILSIITNCGILAIFKYFNFFNDNITSVSEWMGWQNHIPYLNILLPIGLSFHTFQAMSYTIEVYRGHQKSERHFGIYALYVMFYPQLVAGPIERPQNLLPQYHEVQRFDWEEVKQGLVMMAFGMFKKVVIADRLAVFVDAAYNDVPNQNGLTLAVATVFFAFQIYCDFSGYSEIAIGAARVMGFKLMTNFNAPYTAASIAEFWRKWHISLSSWFRDYLYIPLGGNRVGVNRRYINLFLVFMVSGFWHGANWTFVIWGSLHGIYLVLALLRDKYVNISWLKEGGGNLFKTGLNVLLTFILVDFTWIFFRAANVGDAFEVIRKIGSLSFSQPLQSPLNHTELLFCLLVIAILSLKEYYITQFNTRSNLRFFLLFTLLAVVSYLFGVFNSNQFIYFQF